MTMLFPMLYRRFAVCWLLLIMIASARAQELYDSPQHVATYEARSVFWYNSESCTANDNNQTCKAIVPASYGEFREWRYGAVETSQLPGKIPAQLNLDLAGTDLNPSQTPDEILQFYRLQKQMGRQTGTAQYQTSLCLHQGKKDVPPELLEIPRRDAATIDCQKQESAQQLVCHITTSYPLLGMRLAVINGSFDQACTRQLLADSPDTINDSILAVVSYRFKQQLYQSSRAINQTAIPSDSKAPPLLVSGIPVNQNDKPDNRRPPDIIPDLELMLTVSGLILDRESLDDGQAAVSGWESDSAASGVQVNFLLNGGLHSFQLSATDWAWIQWLGFYKSPARLFLLLRQFSLGQEKMESLARELAVWIGVYYQSFAEQSLAGQPLTAEGSLPDRQGDPITQVLDEIAAMPLAEVSVQGALQSHYEERIQQHTGWQPSEAELPLPRSEYLQRLKTLSEQLAQLNRMKARLAVAFSTEEDPEGEKTLDTSSLAALEEDTKGRIHNLTRTVVERFLTELEQQTIADKPEDGMVTVPGQGQKAGKPKTGPIDSKTGSPVTSAGSTSLPAVPDGQSRQDDLPPPLAPETVVDNDDNITLRQLLNEMIYDRSTNPLVNNIPSAGQKTTFMMFSLEGSTLNLLINFIAGETGLLTLEGQVAAPVSGNLWTQLEQFNQLHWLRKGVIIPLLWAQGETLDNPLIRQVANADVIYQVLESFNGPLQIHGLLEPTTERLIFDAMLLVQLSRHMPAIADRLHFSEATERLLVDHILQFILHTPPVWSAAEVESLSQLNLSNELAESLLNHEPVEPGEDLFEINEARGHLAGIDFWQTLEFVRQVSSGGEGTVFEVKVEGQVYALKFVKIADERQRASLNKSSQVIQHLIDQPISGFHCVVTQQLFTSDGLHYFQLMHWVPETLQQRLGGERMEGVVLYPQYISPLVEQMALLHSNGIFHRDLKLENIGLDDGRLIILDLDNLIKKEDFDVTGLASQAVMGNSNTEFNTMVGTAPFGGPGYQEMILDESSTVKANALLHDLATLANIWFQARTGRPLMITYRNNLATLNKELTPIFGSGIELTGFAPNRLMQAMYQHMAMDGSVLPRLFELAGAQMDKVDYWVVDHLLMNPDKPEGALENFRQLASSYYASPENLEEQVDTATLPTSSFVETVEINTATQDDIITFVQRWRSDPIQQIYMTDTHYLLGSAITSKAYEPITLEYLLDDTVDLWGGKQSRQYKSLGLRVDVPLCDVNETGMHISAAASEMIATQDANFWAVDLIDLINRMAAAHSSNIYWANFVPYITRGSVVSDNDITEEMYLSYDSDQTTLSENRSERMEQIADNLVSIAAMVSNILWVLEPSDNNEALLSLTPQGLKEQAEELVSVAMDTVQMAQYMDESFLAAFSTAGKRVMRRKYGAEMARIVRFRLFVNGILHSLKALMIELEQKTAQTFQHNTINFYETRLESHQRNLEKQLLAEIKNDQQVAHYIHKQAFTSWLQKSPDINHLILALQSSPLNRELQSLIVEEWLAQGTYAGDTVEKGRQLGRITNGHLVLIFRALGQSQYMDYLAEHDPNNRTLAPYFAAHAQTVSVEQISQATPVPIGFKRHLHWARQSQRLYQRGFKVSDFPDGMLTRAMAGNSFATQWEADSHPFMVLMSLESQLKSSFMDDNTRKKIRHNLDQSIDSMQTLYPDSRQPPEVSDVQCHVCKNNMKKVQALDLHDKYYQAQGNHFVINCDGCPKLLAEVYYDTGNYYASDGKAFTHCGKCEMDYCTDCQSDVVCSQAGCSEVMKKVTADDLSSNTYGYSLGAYCDQCGKSIFRTDIEQCTVDCTEHPPQANPLNPVWHCSGGHDICQSCLLRNRGEPKTGTCSLHKRPTETTYGRSWMNCFSCEKPIKPGEIVGKCPNHYPPYYNKHRHAYAHKDCLKQP